jgi:hypothetical protein
MGTIRSVNRLVLILGALAVALLPVALLRAANPHTTGDSSPCVWNGQSGATGSGVLSHPYSKTYGDINCDLFHLDWASFRGSDGQWYWYDGEWDSFVAIRHFCSDEFGGTGTCWWADQVLGIHQSAKIVNQTWVYSDFWLTSATCVGC